jgi:hypothetical protein
MVGEGVCIGFGLFSVNKPATYFSLLIKMASLASFQKKNTVPPRVHVFWLLTHNNRVLG